ncbi:MAG TPA: hypothetical protein VIO14_07595 [Dehalococcoidia bacterium]
MEERSLRHVCPQCGRPHDAGDGHGPSPLCDGCFDAELRAMDAGFLRSYVELGATRAQVVAEACLRTLVLAAPEHRKVLAATILEQLVLAARELIGLYLAVRDRTQRPILRSFLEFRLTPEAVESFLADVRSLGEGGLLEALGLPHPDAVAARRDLPPKERRSLELAVRNVLFGLEAAAGDPEVTGPALLAAALPAGGTPAALVGAADWLRDTRLSADQVAALALDPARRVVHVTPLRVDEGQLGRAVDAVDILTEAARDLARAYLKVQGGEGAPPAGGEAVRP